MVQIKLTKNASYGFVSANMQHERERERERELSIR